MKQVNIEDLIKLRNELVRDEVMQEDIKRFEINPKDLKRLTDLFIEQFVNKGYTNNTGGIMKIMGIKIIGNKKIKRGYIKVIK